MSKIKRKEREKRDKLLRQGKEGKGRRDWVSKVRREDLKKKVYSSNKDLVSIRGL